MNFLVNPIESSSEFLGSNNNPLLPFCSQPQDGSCSMQFLPPCNLCITLLPFQSSNTYLIKSLYPIFSVEITSVIYTLPARLWLTKKHILLLIPKLIIFKHCAIHHFIDFNWNQWKWRGIISNHPQPGMLDLNQLVGKQLITYLRKYHKVENIQLPKNLGTLPNHEKIPSFVNFLQGHLCHLAPYTNPSILPTTTPTCQSQNEENLWRLELQPPSGCVPSERNEVKCSIF